ncbi:parp domain-containing protein [Purpureocillium lavendulum]|uniref:Parp domain-containing protein n=1 Tax=Purpureocillium lavendulum TaxID=1247861 RepID=A0AB34FU19_9HYPO|nr:parp domain-containing protein [Purpureocillium lavendulum]
MAAAASELSDDDLVQLSVLRDEETDGLVEAGHLSDKHRWDSPLESTISFEYDEMTLHVTPGPAYPVAQPAWEIVNRSMPIDAVDGLRRRLRGIIAEGHVVNTAERLRAWVAACDGREFDYSKVITLMADEARRALAVFRIERERKTPTKRRKSPASQLGFDMKRGVDIQMLSSSELALRYLGKTPQDVAAMIPPQYRVQHIEEVIRKDLAVGFDQAHAQLRAQLSELPLRVLRRHAPPQMCRSTRVSDYVEHLSRPRLTFHGTQRRFVSSIVRHGFLRPGMRDPSTGAAHAVRCGATYGRGIYSSPDAGFGLAYADWWCGRTAPGSYFGVKLVVCATLMGRARLMYREDGWREHDEAHEGADSHVGNDGLEYVVFAPERILPVYVVHLDWGDDNAAFFEDVPDDPAEYAAWAAARASKNRRKTAPPHPRLLGDDAERQSAGDRQRAREAVFARAAKYFPYGYGPASGTSFQVLEVGEVSEDEEDYGEYQEQRVDGGGGGGDGEGGMGAGGYWSWQKMGEIEDHGGEEGLARDEYLAQKRAHGPAWSDVLLPDEEGGRVTKEDVEDDDYEFCLGRLMGAEDGQDASAYDPAAREAEARELATLIGKIDTDALAARASRLRNGVACTVARLQYDAKTRSSVMGGMNYHIELRFKDGVVWIARIRRFNATSPPAPLRDYIVRSEVATLRFLEQTAVPAPKVHEFALEGPDNPVGVGFILMDKMPGRSLRWSTATPEQRKRVMDQIADVFIELQKNPFRALGSLDESESTRIGPFARESLTNFEGPEMQTIGPCSSWQEYQLSSLRLVLDLILREEMYTQRPMDAYLIHRFLIDLVPCVLPPSAADGKFYLKHADDKGDHVLVDDDFNVTAIIDWEWAHTAPAYHAFNSPIGFLPVAEFYDGKSTIGVDEAAFAQLLESKGRNDLAIHVKRGRVQHLFTFCSGYDLEDWDGFLGLFRGLRDAAGKDGGMGWDEWRATAMARYSDDEGLRSLLVRGTHK